MRALSSTAGLAILAACQQAQAPIDSKQATNAEAPSGATNAVAPRTTLDEEGGRESRFTELDESACRLIEENREEGPYWRRACPGIGGYSVEWTESDLRQGLELTDVKGTKTSLDLSGLAANGAFNHLGPRIEWRGRGGDTPDALIVRIFVADGSNPEAPEKSLLAVARLTPKPCLISIIPAGSEQNSLARRAADLPGACL